MPERKELQDMVQHLQAQGINLDVPLRQLMQKDVLSAANPNALPTDIIIGPRFVFVTKKPDVGGRIANPAANVKTNPVR